MPPRLPAPPPQYDVQDQAALRREIELSIAKVESAATGSPGSVAAPIDGQFVTHTNDVRLTNQRVLTATSEVSFDTSVVSTIKAVIAAAIARLATSQVWTALQTFANLIIVGAGTAPANSGAVTIKGGSGIGIVSRTSNWQLICEHDSADKQFRVDNTTGSVNFHHGAAASVASNAFLSATNKDVTHNGLTTMLDDGAGNSARFKSTSAGVAPIVRFERTAVTARVWQVRLGTNGKLQLIDESGGVQIAEFGTNGTVTTISGAGLTVDGGVLNITGSAGLKFGALNAGSFADATYVYITDYSGGTKGLRVNYGTGDMINKDGNKMAAVIISSSAPSGTALDGTLWCKV